MSATIDGDRILAQASKAFVDTEKKLMERGQIRTRPSAFIGPLNRMRFLGRSLNGAHGSTLVVMAWDATGQGRRENTRGINR